MTQETQDYATGDWIVHRHYGVGQIKGTEVKRVSGQKNTYYKIQTLGSTFWMPVEKLNDEWVRPLAAPAEIQQALEVLRCPPRAMDADINKRRSRIYKVKPNHSPAAIAELLRDLWARKKEKKMLAQAEEKALRYFTDIFLAEWSICLDLEMEKVRQQLNDILTQA